MANRPRIVIVDNRDSFTYNIYQYLLQVGAEAQVHGVDDLKPGDMVLQSADGLVISPGPGAPEAAHGALDIFDKFHTRIPILGVCLGHQIIAMYFGGHVGQAPRVMHGKVSTIENNGQGLFQGLPATFKVARYHSLIVAPETVPPCLAITSQTIDAPGQGPEIMGLAHRDHCICGVQFHPEAIQSEHGHALLRNFIGMCQ